MHIKGVITTKVLYLINFAGQGGTEKYVERLVHAFHPDQCQCCLCYHIEGPLVQRMKALGVPTFHLKMRHPFDLSAAKQLAALCRREHVDVIHAQYPRENYIAILSRIFGNGVRVVFTAHLTLKQPLPWKIANRIVTRKDHRVIAVCNAGAEILKKNGISQNRITVVFNGVDADTMPHRDRSVWQEFGIPKEALVLTILARLSPEKGLDFLIDAIQALQKKTERLFRVVIAGDGELLEALKRKIGQAGLTETVLLLGYRTDTARLLAASDIYMNSSQSEAMSLSILEALANQLPIMATDVGGNRELVATKPVCGMLSPYGDVEHFSDGLCQMIEDAGLRRQYSAAAYQKAKGMFSLKQMIERVYQTYQPK